MPCVWCWGLSFGSNVCISCLSHCKVRYVSSGILFCLQVRAWTRAFHIVVTQWTNVEWINYIKTVTLTSSKQHQPELGDSEEKSSEWCHYFKVYSQETWDVSPGTHSRSFYDPRLSFYFGVFARAGSPLLHVVNFVKVHIHLFFWIYSFL